MKATHALLIVLGGLGLTAARLPAQTTFFWRGEAGSGDWNNNTHWWNGSPTNAGFGILNFSNNNQVSMTNNIPGTLNTHALLFDSGASAVRTIGGNAVRLFDNAGADPFIRNASAAVHVLNLPLEGDGDAGDPLRILIDGSAGLTFGGTINNRGSNIHVEGSTTSAVTVALNGVVSGAGGLYINQANTTVSLGANHSFTGQTTLDAGTLRIASGGSLADSDVRLASGSQLQVNSSGSVASLAERGTSNGGTVSIASGATLTVTGGNKGGLFQNTISGQGNLVMAGSGTTSLNLYGPQTWTGSTSISGGRISSGVALATSSLGISGGEFEATAANILPDSTVVTLSGTGLYTLGGNETIGNLAGTGGEVNLGSSTLTLGAANADAVFAGLISGSGSLEKIGSGALTLNATHSYAGNTTVSAGSLFVNGQLASGTVSVGAAATFGGTGELTGGLTLDADSLFHVASLSQALTVGGSISFGSGFGIANLTGIAWDDLTLNQGYTLLNSSQDFSTTPGLANFGFANRVPVGSLGREAYFQNGSLQVVVIPEPAAALLGGLGLLALLRRRR